MPATEKPFEHEETAQRRIKMKTLPYHHDTSLLATEGVDSEHGTGRAMRSFMETEQANWDALGEEMRRFTMLFNEREADTAYLKQEYETHEQVSTGTPQASVQGHNVWVSSWNEMVNVVGEGGDTPPTDVIAFQPYWCGENMHVDRLAFGLGEDTALSAKPVDPAMRAYLAIYNGDGPGGAPGSLLVDGGMVPDDLTIPNVRVGVDIDVDLHKGQWYWLGLYVWPPARFGGTLPYESFRTDPNLNYSPALEGLPQWTSWTNGPMFFGLDSENFGRDSTVVQWEYYIQALGDDPGAIPAAGFPDHLPFNEYDFTTPTTWTGPYYSGVSGTVMFMRVP